MIFYVIFVYGYILIQILIQVIFSILFIALPFWLTYLSAKKGRFFGLGIVIISLIGQIVFWIISKGYLLFSFKDTIFIDMKDIYGISFDYTVYKYVLLASLGSIVLGLGSILFFKKTIKISSFIIFIVSAISLGLYTNRINESKGYGEPRLGFRLGIDNISDIKTLGSSKFQEQLKKVPQYEFNIGNSNEVNIGNSNIDLKNLQSSRKAYLKEIKLGNSNIDLKNLQTAGKTYLKDEKYIYARTYTYDGKGNQIYLIKKLDLDINQVEFFLDGEWEYVKDNKKVYYLRGSLDPVTELSSKNQNGSKQWSIKAGSMNMNVTNTSLIDFIKSASSVYIKDLRKLNENYSTDGKKLYYTIKGNIQFEIKLGNSNIALNNISMLGKYYIRYKNNIYSIRRINSNTSGITKLDLNIQDMQFLSGQYEYINYNKNKITKYYEYIKDKNKVYYMRDMSELLVVGSISKQTVNVRGEKHPEGDKKLKLDLLYINNEVRGDETMINKTIIDFLSGVVPMKEIK